MKIRIKGNSIRLRLSKTEVSQFCAMGSIVEVTNIGDHLFSYRLEKRADLEAMDASFTDGCICMLVPAALVADWENNTIVGFEHYKPLPGGGQLFLLLEKDFKCIDAEVLEDQSDNYEHPSPACN